VPVVVHWNLVGADLDSDSKVPMNCLAAYYLPHLLHYLIEYY